MGVDSISQRRIAKPPRILPALSRGARRRARYREIAYTLIVSALIIGSSILVSRPGLTVPEAEGYRIVLFAAIAGVIALLTGTARAVWRKRHAQRRAD
jgi:hypothetical protein